MINRRDFIATTGLALGAAMLLPRFAFAASVDTAELMKPGPLGDKGLGKPDAPKVVIEYASLTCSHCRHFHDTTYRPFKEKYVNSGQVYFIFREFPLDALATAGFMLARAAPNDGYFPMVDLLFERQEQWAFVQDPVSALLAIAKQVGFTQETFELTLKNQALLDGVNAVKDRAATTFGVDATPTFFINGEKKPGALSIEELDQLLA